MLKHIVIWKLKPEAEGKTKAENALWLKEHLEALLGVISGLCSVEVGINVKESETAYDAVLVSTFDNQESLEAYKVHPAHLAVSGYCKKIRDGRVEVDYYC